VGDDGRRCIGFSFDLILVIRFLIQFIGNSINLLSKYFSYFWQSFITVAYKFFVVILTILDIFSKLLLIP